ncbi:MAG: hypothetical protein ACLUD2_09210 [Clostridium sp.]
MATTTCIAGLVRRCRGPASRNCVGGHPHGCRLSLKGENVGEFRRRLNEASPPFARGGFHSENLDRCGHARWITYRRPLTVRRPGAWGRFDCEEGK